MTIIKEKTRWDKDGSSFNAIQIVQTQDYEEIQEELNFRCHCEHDCCGHVSSRVENIRPLSGNRYAVKTYGYRNI